MYVPRRVHFMWSPNFGRLLVLAICWPFHEFVCIQQDWILRYIYICIGCASCVYSIHVIAIHRKKSGKLKAVCFGYSQNSNVCAWGIPCFVFIVAAGCWELTYSFWKAGLKMFFLFWLSGMLPSLKLTNRPWKLMVGRWLSFFGIPYFQVLC